MKVLWLYSALSNSSSCGLLATGEHPQSTDIVGPRLSELCGVDDGLIIHLGETYSLSEKYMLVWFFGNLTFCFNCRGYIASKKMERLSWIVST
jgi:hypothetical protein